MEISQRYNVIMPITWGNDKIISWSVPYIKKNLNPNKIILVGPRGMESRLTKIEGTEFLDGNTICEEMNKENIDLIISKVLNENNLENNHKRAGWYMQQYIKMGYSLICEEESYIVWDTDTVPLKSLHLYHSQKNKYEFYVSNENHKEYFDTMSRLAGKCVSKYDESYSFVSQFMIFNTKIMKELLNKMEESPYVEGNNWWQKSLYAVTFCELLESGFSEFETYGNYVMRCYPDKYDIYRPNLSRNAFILLGENPNDKILRWASRSYEILVFEQWENSNKFWAELCKIAECINISLKTVDAIYGSTKKIGEFFRKVFCFCLKIIKRNKKY